MLKCLELKCFRKHEDTLIEFTRGLNVLRGPNESGKTTITEAVLYALYGSKTLRNPLAETVTFSRKETELRVRLVLSAGGVDYIFTRSKSGAEVNWDNGKVVGQAEVSAFAAQLLGADAKTAGLLMMASQSDLRGALDEGPAAVSSLMGKLANFDLIDKLLEAAQDKLLLGPATPFQQKLAEAEAELGTARAAIPDETVIRALTQEVDTLADQIADREIALINQTNGMDATAEALRQGETANAERDRAHGVLLEARKALEQERAALADAQTKAKLGVAPGELAEARAAAQRETDHDRLLSRYRAFTNLPGYPQTFWDGTKGGFDEGLSTMQGTKLRLRGQLVEASQAVAAKKREVMADGRCPTCGHSTSDPAHVEAHNAAVAAALPPLEAEVVRLQAAAAEVDAEIRSMNALVEWNQRRDASLAPLLAGYVTLDETVFPARVAWVGEPPAATPSRAAAERLEVLERQERLATQAAGRAEAHAGQVDRLTGLEAAAQSIFEGMTLVDLEPLKAAAAVAYEDYTKNAAEVRRARGLHDETRSRLYQHVERAKTAADRVTAAEARIASINSDIKDLTFNNELVKKVKGLKPVITDHLWSTTLAAVSNFFSTLRGKQSVVTKEPSGFKVNGQSIDGLSGSTLDVLALATRVALTKTFVPHSSFLCLDEPASGCDMNRTSNLLGFLATVGFQQTILASHDELSEAVADQVIALGA